MAVQCSKCGEDLLGAVNRCWRCGHEFVSRAGPQHTPPIRRKPVQDPLETFLLAEVIDQGQDPLETFLLAEVIDQGDVPPSQASPEEDDSTVANLDSEDSRWSRRGSPFAVDQTSAAGDHSETVDATPRLPEYPRNAAAIGGTVVAITLGIISFGLAFIFPLGALIVSVVGLIMGVWGIYSRRRGAAIMGLLICCVSFAFAGFNGAVELYTYVHGVSPFAPPIPVTVQE